MASIIAGSNFNFLATIGNIPPTTFANTTVKNKLMHTVIDTIKLTFSIKYTLKK